MISAENLAFLRQLLHERSGLVLSGDKNYLIESRLMPVVRCHGLGSIDDLCRAARHPGAEAIQVAIIEAMVTNETFFFRDKQPFEHLKNHMLPHLIRARSNRKRLRIWCAAASTGQEPYSVAMLIKDFADRLAGWHVDLLATDISTEVLDKAVRGAYTQFEVQRGLPIDHLIRYFKQHGDMWRLDPQVCAMVCFKPLNLLDDFSNLGAFDIVFCRNVLIYFDQDTKSAVLDRLADAVAPDGFLVLGASETTIGLTEKLARVDGMHGLYTPLPAAPDESSPVAEFLHHRQRRLSNARSA